MNKPVNDDALAKIFREARTYNGWQKKDVPNTLLQATYDLLKMAPTSANCSPLRIVFVKSEAEKTKLVKFMAEGNKEKTMLAPVTALLATDTKFYEHLPFLFPHADAKSWFVGDEKKIMETAWRNGTLQAAYFIIAARSLGLDCGPMQGYDEEMVNENYFKDTSFRVNFICNIGYGDPDSIYERSPRFEFDQVCKIV